MAVADYLRFGLGRALRLLQAMNGHPMLERLRGLTVPTLLVAGSLDPVLPEERARQMAQVLRRGRLVVIPGVGHAVTFAAPDHLVRTIREFMADDSFPPPVVESDGAGTAVVGGGQGVPDGT
jgi:pimeloyl-ACP methyl ester carboxylesterase